MGVTIDVNAVVENARNVAKQGRPVIAVVKNNAYNLGLEPMVKALLEAGVEHFMVTTLSEATEVRHLAPKARVLLMNPLDTSELAEVRALHLDVVIPSLAWLERNGRLLSGVRLHVKVDVGMNRFGAKSLAEAEAIITYGARERLTLVGLCTHFPLADTEGAEAEHEAQVERFASWSERLRGMHDFEMVHAANSAETLRGNPLLIDCTHVRVGILLYGYSPVEPVDWLIPALHWTARVIAINEVAPGQHVGYGTSYTAERSERIAVLDVGYGDGLLRSRRHLPVYIHGQAYPFVSNIFMSHSFVRVDDSVAVGDSVELYGSQIKVDDVTRAGVANNSEQLCARSWRLPHQFKEGSIWDKHTETC